MKSEVLTICDDGMAKRWQKLPWQFFGIDQLDQDPREAWKPLQFRPAQHLQQPTGRSAGVPRSSSAPLCLATSPLRARRDQSGAAASTTSAFCCGPQQQGCHPPPAPRRRSASRPDPRS